MELCLPCLAIVKQFYVALKAQGGSKLGTQAIIKVLENLNNHRIGI
jgi:3-hydroxyisobutyrate dehydrogenase-like beta-hydroxyacid dehydrogenase